MCTLVAVRHSIKQFKELENAVVIKYANVLSVNVYTNPLIKYNCRDI